MSARRAERAGIGGLITNGFTACCDEEGIAGADRLPVAVLSQRMQASGRAAIGVSRQIKAAQVEVHREAPGQDQITPPG